MCHSSILQNRDRAFTLIELLVVIGIIAVLASILFPVLGTVHAQGDSIKCAANLRQMGTAINGYAGDHDGRLPGPLEPLIFPAYTDNAAANVCLVKFLAPYLSISTKTATASAVQTETVTTCPAFLRTVRDKTLPSYVLNFADQLPDLKQVPWGDASGNTQPVQMAVLTAWADTAATGTYIPSANGQRNLSRTWAIKDADLQSFTNMAGVGSTAGLPDKAVHGDYRNALFYDWHVGKIDLNDIPK